MEVIFTPKALEDLNFWKRLGNKAIQNKIQQLILAICYSERSEESYSEYINE